MYDENSLYDEVEKTLKNTGQDIFKLIEELNRLSGSAAPAPVSTDTEYNVAASPVPTTTELKSAADNNAFVFTGQSTDLRFFANNDTMPISMIEKIPDVTLRKAVSDEFGKAVLCNKITFDKEKGTFKITEKGREFISRPEFKRAAANDLANMKLQQSQTIEFELNGTVNDLNFFNQSGELHLPDIVANPNKKAVQNVLSNLVKMKDSGLISVSDSVVRITDKGKKLLNDDLFKLASKGAADKAVAAVGSVPGVVVVAAKKAAETAVKLVQK